MLKKSEYERVGYMVGGVLSKDEIRLIKPAMEYADDIMKYRQEFLDSGDSLDGCGNLKMCASADEWIRTIDLLENDETCPEGIS